MAGPFSDCHGKRLVTLPMDLALTHTNTQNSPIVTLSVQHGNALAMLQHLLKQNLHTFLHQMDIDEWKHDSGVS